MRLGAWLNANRVLQTTFAFMVDISPSHLSNIIAGDSCSLECANKIVLCTKGGVQLSDLNIRPEKKRERA